MGWPTLPARSASLKRDYNTGMDDAAKIRATLRVVPDQTGGAVPRPSPQKVDEAARKLGALGFQVLRRSRFGVDVLGSPDQYREHLNVSIPSGQRSFVGAVQDKALRDLVDSVEVIPPATLI